MAERDMRGRKLPIQERFWMQVNTSGPSVNEELGPCWLWMGSVSKSHGYGTISGNGRGYRVHRYSYELNIGKCPSTLLVCHKCDVRRCVRPSHLFLGTAKDNYEDAKKKCRTRAKPRIVIEIGRLYGRLTPTRPTLPGNSYMCFCACGKERIVAAKCLASGHTQSCGCFNKDRLSQVHKGHTRNRGRPCVTKLNRSGKTYGLLLAVKEIEKGRWLCICKCGNKTSVLSTNLAEYAKSNRGCSKCQFSRGRR